MKIFNRCFRLLFILFSILWMELLLRQYCFSIVFDARFIYVVLFTIPITCLIYLLSSLFTQKINMVIFMLTMVLLGLFYSAQLSYYTVFKAFLMPDKLTLADDVFSSFLGAAIDAFLAVLPYTLLIFSPLIALVFYLIIRAIKKSAQPLAMFDRLTPAPLVFCTLFLLTTQILSIAAVHSSNNGILSPQAIYTHAFSPELSMRNFGALTTLRLNIAQLFFKEDAPTSNNITSSSTVPAPVPASSSVPDDITATNYSANILPIDFEALAALEDNTTIANMHLFFASQQPTLQNEYTGMFEGKNLIFITAEALAPYAINEQYTPTLYALANEGFVFENFYTPLWWNSTNDGEFVSTNGLYPLSYTRAFYETHDNLLPFTMGNALAEEGYETIAYHNHYYNYYDRNLTHPNMGYDFYGLGNGLNVTETWPESDLEMMELTIGPALEGDDPFHLYYMTVSGHMYYTLESNYISFKNYDAVASLDMSEEAQAYIACQIELDLALEYILEQLELAGQLENTVICISSDHYPYGLSEQTLTEFLSTTPDEFELHRNSLILWSGDMQQPIYINKVSSSVDILPTLLNLFGISYDSRLLSGRDILSTAPGVALFSNQSFITDEGRYSAVADTWYPNDGSNADYSYASETFAYLQQLTAYNEQIITTDYYRYLFSG